MVQPEYDERNAEDCVPFVIFSCYDDMIWGYDIGK